jgi:hypothetical protein
LRRIADWALISILKAAADGELVENWLGFAVVPAIMTSTTQVPFRILFVNLQHSDYAFNFYFLFFEQKLIFLLEHIQIRSSAYGMTFTYSMTSETEYQRESESATRIVKKFTRGPLADDESASPAGTYDTGSLLYHYL